MNDTLTVAPADLPARARPYAAALLRMAALQAGHTPDLFAPLCDDLQTGAPPLASRHNAYALGMTDPGLSDQQAGTLCSAAAEAGESMAAVGAAQWAFNTLRTLRAAAALTPKEATPCMK